jgi:uncharacterized alkaline shock family protein YloU
MDENLGSVTVSPDVLLAVIRLTTLATPGVARLSSAHPSSFRRLFKGKVGEGIRMEIEDGAVSIDLHIVAEPDARMLPLGQTLQREISRAIHHVLGMPVKGIDIHIEDVADRVASPIA